MNLKKPKPNTVFALLFLALFLIAGALRFYQLDWDEGMHLHPDERYLTMVVSALNFPERPADYFDTANSPLNPTNRGQPGYVYGTLPLFATRAVGEWLEGLCHVPDPADGKPLLLEPCPAGFYTGYGNIHLVGRALSTVVDLATLLALILLARTLYGDRVALLSGGLYAFTVLSIQHAHFFVVDSFVTVFVTWTLLFAVYTIRRRQPAWLVLAGVTTGLALASKISVWPLPLVVALASVLHRRPQNGEDDGAERYTFSIMPSRLMALVAAGVACVVVFRIAQPYAFAGPGFFDVKLEPQWVNTMRDVRQMASGEIDVPFGHQWTRRIPIILPGLNMIFWGMGLPLGLAAWVGWAVLGWFIVKRGQWRHLIPWSWGTLFFLYQSTQWVKSMRYLLPVYPVFVLFASWVLLWGQQHARRTRVAEPAKGPPWRRDLRTALRLSPAIVLIGTALWAWAFVQIYARPVSRIQATRWMYHNIPAAATVHTLDSGSVQLPLYQSGSTLAIENPPQSAPLTPEEPLELTEVVLNKVMGVGVAERRVFQVSVSLDPWGNQTLASTSAPADVPAGTDVAVTLPFASPVPLEAGQTVHVVVHLLEGPPIHLDTSVIANEHWDDPLPLRIDGRDPFWNWYRGLSSSPSSQMNLYDNDTSEKRRQLLDWLDETDYIVLSSNRLYGSIPRLPTRYPLTVEYYDKLFDGRLGFELLAEFVSFPTLGPCQFPDQETPFEVKVPRHTNAYPCSIPYPPAEEAYSVYDHPQVLIFVKTEAYAREKAEALLPESLLAGVQWVTPRQATRSLLKQVLAPGDDPSLLMSPRARIVQESGGTWSRLFDRQALQNRFPALGVVLWWLVFVLMGWMAYPWLYLAFPALRYRGYGLAKAAGLLLWAYPAWLLSALHLLPHTQLLVWIIFLLLSVGSVFVVYTRYAEFCAFLKAGWKHLLRVEIIFVILYLVWVYVRYLNPDLWHPVSGGEKPMDFAYLNAVIKSSWFPPYDPWFSGGVMNYYYFGFVMVGTVIKALGIVPSVAYNLAVPSFFALTGVGAYTLASNLAGGDEKRSVRTGLIGLALVLLLGNLGEFRLLFKEMARIGNVEFESFIPGYPALVSTLRGLWKVAIEGQPIMFRPEWWYWDATRMIPFKAGEVGPINEFPLFTFLYADLHAHMMAFPLAQLALGIALQWGMDRDLRPQNRRSALSDLRYALTPRPLTTFLLAALVAAAIRATNTWDYPTYVALMSIGYLFVFLQPRPVPAVKREESEEHDADHKNPHSSLVYLRFLVPVMMVLLAELLIRPYTARNATVYTSFGIWEGMRTPSGIYLLMHGHLLFPLVVLSAAQGYALWRRLWRFKETSTLTALGVVVGSMLLMGLVLVYFGVSIAWITVPLGAIAAILMLEPETSPRMRILWFWAGTALALSIAVEIVVLKGDLGRMNTVFKFYLQVWMLLALSAAVATERIIAYTLQRIPVIDVSTSASQLWELLQRTPVGDLILSMMLILFFLAALYPTLAIPAKVRDRWNPDAPTTLDGTAFAYATTQYEHGSPIPLGVDLRVIRWLQENVAGSPVIMEAQAEREYLWGNRISVHTGLPSVVGWRWHQVQQRMIMTPGIVEMRQADVRDFYNTPVPERAWEILEQYGVGYVVLTPYEKAYMLPEGKSKFETMVDRGWLDIVYQEPEATIYRVVGEP